MQRPDSATSGLPLSVAGLWSPDTAWWGANNGLIPPDLLFLFSVSSRSGFSLAPLSVPLVVVYFPGKSAVPCFVKPGLS